jgi:DNA-binding transcriptional ArsR family regulator
LSAEAEEETYSLIFSSLKHPVRRKILRTLANGQRTFSSILEQVDVESSHLSYHLENLNGLIRKQDNEYYLSSVGRAAVSLMSKVEEPASTRLLVKRSLLSFLKATQKTWLLGIMIVVLVVSLLTNFYLVSSNSQLNSAVVNEMRLVVQDVSFSLDSLSGVYGLPAPTVRHEYSNVSIITAAMDHIVTNVHYGSQSLQQLINLDPTHQKDLQMVDDLFKGFLRFANLLSFLSSENKTSRSVELIEQLSDRVNDVPRQIGSELRSAYGSLGGVDEYILQQAVGDADMTGNMIDDIIMQAVS